MDKFEQRYKGYESQRSKRYDPEKVPTYKKAQNKESGEIRFVTNADINSGGWIPVQTTTETAIEPFPKKHFLVGKALWMGAEDQVMKDRIFAYLKTMQEKGILYEVTEEEVEIANLIEEELKKVDEAGLAALQKALGLDLPPGGGEAKPPTSAKERIQILRNAGVDKETIRLILIKEGLIDG